MKMVQKNIYTPVDLKGYNPRQLKLLKICIPYDLYFDTYTIGGRTNYKFFDTPTDYFGGDGIFVAQGIKNAELFAFAYKAGIIGYLLKRSNKDGS